jgi:Asp-tRNA(Asn)/Glu-tRNA(Gln) amidotransferase C subunit
VEPALRAPTADAGAEVNVAAVAHARPDTPADFAAREDMLASAPKLQAPFIYIPRIATTDDAA